MVGRSGPKPSCVSREPKSCLSLLLPKPLEKAFSQSIFAHVRVSCQKVFIFSVQKMDEHGRAQQINFQSRKARAPAVFLLLQPFSQVSLSVTSVLLNSSLSSMLGCTPEGKRGLFAHSAAPRLISTELTNKVTSFGTIALLGACKV